MIVDKVFNMTFPISMYYTSFKDCEIGDKGHRQRADEEGDAIDGVHLICVFLIES